MNSINKIDILIKSLKSLVEDVEVAPLPPKELSDVEGFEQIHTSLLEGRRAFIAMSKGEFEFPITSKGYFPGAIKSLQATLKHLMWQMKVVSLGDYTQRIDYLGEFSDSFNKMTECLAGTMNELAVKEKEIREAKDKWELIFNTIPDAVLITRLSDNCIVDMNDGFAAITGYTREEVIGKSSIDIRVWNSNEERQRVIDQIIKNRFCENVEYDFRMKNGNIINGIVSAKVFELHGAPHVISVTHDITKRKTAELKLQQSEEKYRLLTEFTSDVIWVLNLRTERFTYISPSIYHLRGITAQEAMNETLEETMVPQSLELTRNAINRNITEFLKNPDKANYYLTEIQQPCKNGDIIWVEVSTKFRYNTEGDIEIVGVSRNIEERKKSENKILYLSYHDQLTGLYNRRFYEETLKRFECEKCVPLTLIMIDVNGLKLTNDAFGHNMGDLLLKKVANILQSKCRKNDIVARVGGDEFIILLPKTDAKKSEAIINRINAAIASEKIDNIILSVSVGYAVKKDSFDNMNEVFMKAEDNMYKHKLSESTSMRSKTIEIIMNSLFEKNNREMLHSKRVSKICEQIAISMCLEKDEVNQIRIAGLMHDIGKIGINEAILNNPKKLNGNEWNEIQRHSEIGYRILGSTNEFSRIADYVIEHHERVDGAGYPKGLKNDEISMQARIIAVADAFDAMTSSRSYRDAISEEDAVKEIRKCAGTQFDIGISKVFVEKVLKRKWV